MKRKKVFIAVILCFLIGNICQGRVELNFSEILFFCMAFRDMSGQSRVPEIPRTFCALTSETEENKGAPKKEFVFSILFLAVDM